MIVESADHFQRADHAERAVVPSAPHHGIDMRPHIDRRCILGSGPEAGHVAQIVDPHLEPGLGHPAREQVAGDLVFIGKRQPRHPAARRRANGWRAPAASRSAGCRRSGSLVNRFLVDRAVSEFRLSPYHRKDHVS